MSSRFGRQHAKRQASNTRVDSIHPLLKLFLSLANLHDQDGVLAGQAPTRTIKLIWVKTLLSPLSSQTPAIAENRVIGTIKDDYERQ